jgi:hypothetical protein
MNRSQWIQQRTIMRVNIDINGSDILLAKNGHFIHDLYIYHKHEAKDIYNIYVKHTRL